MKTILFICLGLILCGCSSIPSRMNRLDVGMSESDAIKIMGEPDSKSANFDHETLNYTHHVFGGYEYYFVKIVGDKVDSFGQVPQQPLSPQQSQLAAMMLMNNMRATQSTQTPIYQMPVTRTQQMNCTTSYVGTQAYTNCN